MRTWLIERAPLNETPDPVDDWIRMVAINRLTGHSPGFFSVYTLPPNQAVFAQSQRKINEQRGLTPPDRDIQKIILKKSKSLLSDGSMPHYPEALLTTSIAQAAPSISTGSVELVVTSPPFLDIVQYAEDNWLRSWFAGIDLTSVFIAHHRTEAAWQIMVRDTLSELARIVQPGGHVAFEVGEVRGGKVLLERLVWEAATNLPFERLFVMVNQQEFTKTANCWGVQNNAKGTNTNLVVVLRRHKLTPSKIPNNEDDFMDDKERLIVLEQALAQMLKPIKGIPFSVIVKSMSEKEVIQIDQNDTADQELIRALKSAITICASELKSNPIRRP